MIFFGGTFGTGPGLSSEQVISEFRLTGLDSRLNWLVIENKSSLFEIKGPRYSETPDTHIYRSDQCKLISEIGTAERNFTSLNYSASYRALNENLFLFARFVRTV